MSEQQDESEHIDFIKDSTVTELEIPLFPLHSVLFPEGLLPLRVFEPRYLDMISKCMKEDSNFGICLITEGSEVGKPAASTATIGTLANISYWQEQNDGVLGITASGIQKFKINSTHVQKNGLIVAQVRTLPLETQCPLPESYNEMSTTLSEIIQQLEYPYKKLKNRFDEALWVSSRLTEFAPLNLTIKQHCLEFDDPIKRLDYLSPFFNTD